MFFWAIYSCFVQAQVQGKVVDEWGTAIPEVLVYVDGTSIATQTNAEGIFTIELPSGNHQLVFRNENFNNEYIQVNQSTQFLEIILQTEDLVRLEEAVLTPLSNEKWKEYYSLFQALFLGQNEAAKQVKILNPKVLKFKYDAEKRLLTATALAPLKISNGYLGYDLEYDLVEFFMDYQHQYQYLEGTILFTSQKGSQSKQRKWNKNRLEAYNGSLMHFMRALHQEKLKENGFLINRLIRKENPAYLAFKQRQQEAQERGEALRMGKVPAKIIETLVKAEVPYDSLRVRQEDKVILNFKGLYDIEFTGEKEDLSYVRSVKRQDFFGNQNSMIYLLDEKTIEISPNGNFHHPAHLMIEGYFTWEKVAHLLPLDFEMDETN